MYIILKHKNSRMLFRLRYHVSLNNNLATAVFKYIFIYIWNLPDNFKKSIDFDTYFFREQYTFVLQTSSDVIDLTCVLPDDLSTYFEWLFCVK